MKKEKQILSITEIEFNLTSNIFLNSGIVALEHYLNEFKDKTKLKYNFKLCENKLIVECDKLLKLLEDVYYYMGKEIYDTSTEDQKQKRENAYYDTKKEKFVRFPKMKTYGLAALLTNDPAPKTRNKENTKRIDALKKSNPNIVRKFEFYFKKEKLLLQKQLYFNERYTKTTRLEFNPDYLIMGDLRCSLTNESFKKLEDSQCISPFISGISNFNSFLDVEDKMVSWKAKYLSLFSPKIAFYYYSVRTKKEESLNVYFFDSNNLLNLKELFKLNFHKDTIQLVQSEFISNFNLFNWNKEYNTSKDFTESNEFLFMLIFTFYNQSLKKNQKKEIKSNEEDPFAESQFKFSPVSLISFKSESVGKTMRANSFEYFNNFKFIVRLIFFLEKRRINFKGILNNLKFIKPTLKKAQNHYRLERQLRNKVLGKFLNLNSIIDEIETLFYNCYKFRISDEYIPYKDYSNIIKFLLEFEKIIKYGGNNKMNEKLQEWAINFGTMIGQAILRYENAGNKIDVQKINAKNGRRYLIDLYKSRTYDQYNDAIIRIMNKYGIVYRKDLLSEVNEQNFKYIKQLAMISTLNQINFILNPKKEEETIEPK